MTKYPFKSKGECAKELLKLIHTYLCGPFINMARGGFHYYITLTYDYSQYEYLYFIKYKSESFKKFRDFKNAVEKQTGKSIKILLLDCGREYLSTKF